MESKNHPSPGYRIILRPAAEQFFKKLRDEKLGRRLEQALNLLANAPRPSGSKLLSGADQIWRIRVGQYRILYQIDDVIRLVSVAQVGHRREIYR